MATKSGAQPLLTPEKEKNGSKFVFTKGNTDDRSVLGGIEDDFMYGTNVASSHIYIRMGK